MRGRSITNDSAVLSLFQSINNMHPQLLELLNQLDERRRTWVLPSRGHGQALPVFAAAVTPPLRREPSGVLRRVWQGSLRLSFPSPVYYEGLQDKLAQIRDARGALNALREEHREKLRRAAEEAERQRQIQLAQKLEIMRQKKQVSISRVCGALPAPRAGRGWLPCPGRRGRRGVPAPPATAPFPQEYLEMQRQLAIQRLQEQEKERQLRLEQQKQTIQMRAQMPAFSLPYAQVWLPGQRPPPPPGPWGMAQILGFFLHQLQAMPAASGVIYQPSGPTSFPGTFSPASSVEGSPMHSVYMNQAAQGGTGPYAAMPVTGTGTLAR